MVIVALLAFPRSVAFGAFGGCPLKLLILFPVLLIPNCRTLYLNSRMPDCGSVAVNFIGGAKLKGFCAQDTVDPLMVGGVGGDLSIVNVCEAVCSWNIPA